MRLNNYFEFQVARFHEANLLNDVLAETHGMLGFCPVVRPTVAMSIVSTLDFSYSNSGSRLYFWSYSKVHCDNNEKGDINNLVILCNQGF